MENERFASQRLVVTRGLHGRGGSRGLGEHALREAGILVQAIDPATMNRHIAITIHSSPRPHCVALATALLARLVVILLEKRKTIRSADLSTSPFLATNEGDPLREGGIEEALRLIRITEADLVIVVTHSVPFPELVSAYLTKELKQPHDFNSLQNTLMSHAAAEIDRKSRREIPLVPLPKQ